MLGGKQADTLTGGARDDLLLGNAGDDNLTGGEGQDTLIGGANSDTLTGGGGKDQLIGGTGKDTYYVGAGDTVIDSDGNGVINLNGVNLTGGKRKKGSLTYVDDNGNSYLLQGNKLLINGVVV
jgi:Ca2+-binding RTX toxin-like protein